MLWMWTKTCTIACSSERHAYLMQKQSVNASFGRFRALNSYLGVDQSSISQPLVQGLCGTWRVSAARQTQQKKKVFFWCSAELFRCFVHHHSKTEWASYWAVESQVVKRGEHPRLHAKQPKNPLTTRDFTVPFDYPEILWSISIISMGLNIK